MYLECWSSDAKWHSAVKLEVVMNDDYLVIVDSIPTRVGRRTVRASLVFDAFAKKKANGETLMHGSVIVAAHVCMLLRRLGVFIHAHHHVIEDDHVDVTSLVFPKSMHHQLDAIHCYCGVRVMDCVCMSLFFGMYKKSFGDKKGFSSESRGVLDFPQDCSADTHDCGTRLGDVAKPADVSVPFGQSYGHQTVRIANAEFHGNTFLTGAAGKSKILCDGKVSKDTQWKEIEED
jgi:hypothetical protein